MTRLKYRHMHTTSSPATQPRGFRRIAHICPYEGGGLEEPHLQRVVLSPCMTSQMNIFSFSVKLFGCFIHPLLLHLLFPPLYLPPQLDFLSFNLVPAFTFYPPLPPPQNKSQSSSFIIPLVHSITPVTTLLSSLTFSPFFPPLL